jgi:hypothetical protein
MSRNQLLIRELIKQVSEHDLKNGCNKQLTIKLNCGSKIMVKIKIEDKDSLKFKVIKDD